MFLAMSLILMKLTKKRFAHFGICFHNLRAWILIGAAIGAGLTVFMMIFGGLPAIPEKFLHVVCSQLLVGLSEEGLWRGFVLQPIWDMLGFKNKAGIGSSYLFGLSHFLIGGIPLVIVPFLTALSCPYCG